MTLTTTGFGTGTITVALTRPVTFVIFSVDRITQLLGSGEDIDIPDVHVTGSGSKVITGVTVAFGLSDAANGIEVELVTEFIAEMKHPDGIADRNAANIDDPVGILSFAVKTSVGAAGIVDRYESSPGAYQSFTVIRGKRCDRNLHLVGIPLDLQQIGPTFPVGNLHRFSHGREIDEPPTLIVRFDAVDVPTDEGFGGSRPNLTGADV